MPSKQRTKSQKGGQAKGQQKDKERTAPVVATQEPDESEQAFNQADATSQEEEGLQTGLVEVTDQPTEGVVEAVATTPDGEEPKLKSAAQKKWREKNRGKVQEYQKKWRAKNKEKVKEIHTNYRKKNPEKVKEWQKASQARRKAKTVEETPQPVEASS